MYNENLKMINITKDTKKALLDEIRKQKEQGETLENILKIWDKGCKNRDYLEWGNQLTRELWAELEKEKPNKLTTTIKYFLGGFKNV